MKIIFLSSKDNWIFLKLNKIIKVLKNKNHIVTKIHNHKDISKSDILFILGYHKFIPEHYLRNVDNSVVVHESKLPKGRGWSPIAWEIIKNKKKIYFSLIHASNKIDQGNIILQTSINLSGLELFDDIKNIQLKQTEKLCLEFVKKYPKILKSSKQQKGKFSYYRRRHPIDSKVKFNSKISEIFNLLRISDNKKYPVFFSFKGKKFKIKIEKYD